MAAFVDQPLSPANARALATSVLRFVEELGHRGSYGDAIEYVTGYSFETDQDAYLQIKREFSRQWEGRYGGRLPQPREHTVGNKLPTTEIVVAYNRGGTVAGLARQHGCSRSAIRLALVSAGVTIDSQRRGRPASKTKREAKDGD